MATAKVSKNAREGVKAGNRKRICGKGHTLERIKVVPVFGRARLYWRCECGLI